MSLHLLERVANELNDPSGEHWCQEPEEDRKLLEALREDVVAYLENAEPSDCRCPVATTSGALHFNLDTIHGERAMLECLNGPRWRRVAQHMSNWLEARLNTENDRTVRTVLEACYERLYIEAAAADVTVFD